ncbi:hypothetical protein ABK040_003398 [Willaertia magna]
MNNNLLFSVSNSFLISEDIFNNNIYSSFSTINNFNNETFNQTLTETETIATISTFGFELICFLFLFFILFLLSIKTCLKRKYLTNKFQTSTISHSTTSFTPLLQNNLILDYNTNTNPTATSVVAHTQVLTSKASPEFITNQHAVVNGSHHSIDEDMTKISIYSSQTLTTFLKKEFYIIIVLFFVLFILCFSFFGLIFIQLLEISQVYFNFIKLDKIYFIFDILVIVFTNINYILHIFILLLFLSLLFNILQKSILQKILFFILLLFSFLTVINSISNSVLNILINIFKIEIFNNFIYEIVTSGCNILNSILLLFYIIFISYQLYLQLDAFKKKIIYLSILQFILIIFYEIYNLLSIFKILHYNYFIKIIDDNLFILEFNKIDLIVLSILYFISIIYILFISLTIGSLLFNKKKKDTALFHDEYYNPEVDEEEAETTIFTINNNNSSANNFRSNNINTATSTMNNINQNYGSYKSNSYLRPSSLLHDSIQTHSLSPLRTFDYSNATTNNAEYTITSNNNGLSTSPGSFDKSLSSPHSFKKNNLNNNRITIGYNNIGNNVGSSNLSSGLLLTDSIYSTKPIDNNNIGGGDLIVYQEDDFEQDEDSDEDNYVPTLREQPFETNNFINNSYASTVSSISLRNNSNYRNIL